MRAPVLPGSAAAHLKGVLRAEQDERLLRRAVADGKLTQADLEAAEQKVEAGEAQSLADAVVTAGRMERAALEALEATLAREAWSRPPVIREAAELPEEARVAATDPARNLADFILCELRGRGGAGEVWKAWDRRLDRWVAVKISTASLESASGRERFEREGLAAARLRHPNIVPVYQVGADRGRPYLVMPFIEGRALEGMVVEPLRALDLVRTAARAVDHAHKQGLVHRDLKPANIMVDEQGDVFVLDFGLVYLRRESSSRLTRPGDVLGTPAYMSPEQAKTGEKAPDVATDVYGLGATLYALLAGRPPFEGDSFAAVVAKVLNDEPAPLQQVKADLDPRVDAIVRKAMAKDPGRRYASAAELADDLDRLWAGQDPEARPAGPLERAAGWTRRHVALATMMGAAVLVAALGIGFLSRVEAERQAAVDALREVARLSLEAALERRRAGDMAAMRKALPQLQAAYEKVRARGAAAAEAEVEYLMGRMYRALMDDEKALGHQDRALTRDPNYAPAQYERVVLLSAEYGRALDEALGKLPRVEQKAGSVIASAEERYPPLASLGRALIAQVERLQAMPLGEPHARAARGILAFHRGQYKEARKHLEQALAADPLMEEAWDALARAADAAGDWNAASEAYAEAIKRDRGYAPHHLGRCEMHKRVGRYDRSITDAEAALALDADLSGAWNCRAGARASTAHDTMMAGRDPLPEYAAAERDFDEAIRRSGGQVGHLGRGTLLRYRAIHKARHGDDPLADLDASYADLDRAVALEAGMPERYTSRARTLSRRAMYKMERGLDPTADVAAALKDFTTGYGMDRRRADALMWRGDLLAHRARWRHARGEAAEEDFASAERDFSAALAQYSTDPWTHLHRGTMRLWQGEARARAGRADEADASFASAASDLDVSILRLPRYPDSWVQRANLHLARAESLRARGRDAARELVAAAFTLDRAVAVDPGASAVWAARARLDRLRGDEAAAAVAWSRARALNGTLPEQQPPDERGVTLPAATTDTP